MTNFRRLDQDLVRLNAECNKLADQIFGIRSKMEGRGVSPAEAPLVINRMLEVEQRLRMIGASKDEIIPWP